MITQGFAVWPYPSKPPGGGAQWITALWTAPFRKGFFGHMELWFLDQGQWYRGTAVTEFGEAMGQQRAAMMGVAYDPKRDKGGAVYSPWGGAGQILTPNPDWYHYHPLPSDFPFDAAKQFFIAEMLEPTNGYDWAGIHHWVCGLFPPDAERWYCSEISCAALALYPKFAGFAQGDGQFSPNGGHSELHRLGNTEETAPATPTPR